MLVGLPRWLRTFLIVCGLASFVAGADMLITTWSDRGVPAETITICQATDVAKHPYQATNIRIATDGTLPPDVDPLRDVVPPYSYRGVNYPGVNWSAQGQAVWYAGCQGSRISLAAAPSPPVTSTGGPPPQAVTPQPVVGLWPQAVVTQTAVRALAASIMLIGVLMIAAASVGTPREFEPSLARVSSDLSTYSRPRIRPRRSGQ